MNSEKALLLIGGNDEVAEKARKLDLSFVMFQHPNKVTETQRRLADEFHVVDFMNWAVTEPLISELHREWNFAAVVSPTEAGQEPAGRGNDLLGLGGTSYAVTRLVCDKWAMRQHLASLDPDAVGAASLTSYDDLAAFGQRYGYPFIVKPSSGTASFGVFRVGGPEEAADVWAGVKRLRGTTTDRGSLPFPIEEFLMEEYIDGPEFSVESFSFAGRHVIVTITEKSADPVTFTELGHAVPARLGESVQADVRRVVTRFLDLVGITDGPGHTEVRLGPRGPAVIEGHTRIAGDSIADLVHGAYGIDLISYTLGWPVRLVPELPDQPPALSGASVRFLVGVPGQVTSVDGVPDARAQDGVLTVQVSAKPGDTVRPLRDNWDRLGLVAATGPDTTAAIERCAQIAGDFIKIRVTGDDGTVRLASVTAFDDPAPVAQSQA